uniref:Uncharacterized protein n=1 Tax=Anguilla anguilla TaxID=7936 RepID=A0A0E9RZF9_ANGAN
MPKALKVFRVNLHRALLHREIQLWSSGYTLV